LLFPTRPYSSLPPDLSSNTPTITCTAIPPFNHTGWLFLFAVLMAAVLLFTMVFFVSCPSSQAGRVGHPGQEWLDSTRFDCDIHDSYVYDADCQIIMFSDLECGMSLTFILLSSPHSLPFSQLVPAAYQPLSLPLRPIGPPTPT
jgi:hypothetical protein